MKRRVRQHLTGFLAIASLQGCAIPEGYQDATCEAAPDYWITTEGSGPEDIVVPPQDGTKPPAWFLVREVEGGLESPGSCDSENCRIGLFKADPGERTTLAWRPDAEKLHPMGMSLVREAEGDALYVIDAGEPSKLWRLSITDGMATDHDIVVEDNDDGDLQHANDLQAVGDRLYVTRFDLWAWLPWRSGDKWQGITEVRNGEILGRREGGFPGANGIADLGDDEDLVVSDYWNKRLRFIKKTADGKEGDTFASARLPIRPDNLTLDGDRLLVAGQRSAFLAFLNAILPFIPSPSGVIAFDKNQLGDDSMGELLWWGGLYDGRSVSVAVPKGNDLILGQIFASDILHVSCPPNGVS